MIYTIFIAGSISSILIHADIYLNRHNSRDDFSRFRLFSLPRSYFIADSISTMRDMYSSGHSSFTRIFSQFRKRINLSLALEKEVKIHEENFLNRGFSK